VVARRDLIGAHPETDCVAGHIEQALADDPVKNRAELLAEFRTDIESLVALHVVERSCGGHLSMPRARSLSYFAFVDPSGGSEDSMTLAISHREYDERIVIDHVAEVAPPFSAPRRNPHQECVGRAARAGRHPSALPSRPLLR
jgi:hypothetical protein